jgi:hypothetical protein
MEVLKPEMLFLSSIASDMDLSRNKCFLRPMPLLNISTWAGYLLIIFNKPFGYGLGFVRGFRRGYQSNHS